MHPALDHSDNPDIFPSDEIALDPKGLSSFFEPPQEPASSDPSFLKHVRCEGARWHVLHFDTNGTHCSESKCIINKRESSHE